MHGGTVCLQLRAVHFADRNSSHHSLFRVDISQLKKNTTYPFANEYLRLHATAIDGLRSHDARLRRKS